MYTQGTHSSVKIHFFEGLATTPSSLHIIIATIAFGGGIDCPDVCQSIHWGVPQNDEMYIQESGRAGRDSKLSCARIFKSPQDLQKYFTSE